MKINDIIKTAEEWFKKLPPLPANAVDAIYKITPWLAIIFGVLGVLGALGGLGLLTAFAPFAIAGGVNGYGFGYVAAIGLLISSVLMIAAFPGLRVGKLSAWNLLFWSEVINLASSVIGISFGSIIFALIGFYILFQIKPRYK